MELPQPIRCSFEDMSLEEIQGFSAIEIGGALNEIIKAQFLLKDHANTTRSIMFVAMSNGDKAKEREAKLRLQSIGDHARALRLATTIFQSLLKIGS